LSAEDFENYVFSEKNPTYTFYAIFDIHKYWVMFKNEYHDPKNLDPKDPSAYDHIEYIPS
jgi:predicted MPP superfamily phosphohydrolase